MANANYLTHIWTVHFPCSFLRISPLLPPQKDISHYRNTTLTVASTFRLKAADVIIWKLQKKSKLWEKGDHIAKSICPNPPCCFFEEAITVIAIILISQMRRMKIHHHLKLTGCPDLRLRNSVWSEHRLLFSTLLSPSPMCPHPPSLTIIWSPGPTSSVTLIVVPSVPWPLWGFFPFKI